MISQRFLILTSKELADYPRGLLIRQNNFRRDTLYDFDFDLNFIMLNKKAAQCGLFYI